MKRNLRAAAGLLALGMLAHAQFKEIGPAPFPPAEAHRKIKALLDQVDPSNRQQTVKTLIGWLDWYRDILDDELIAAWKGGKRSNLNQVMDELGDARVASEIAKSWRQPGLNGADAPVLSGLMTRYSESAAPFLHDVQQTPDLSRPEAEAVCRVLLDLPDRFRGDALRILPYYRVTAQDLLNQDLRAGNQETIGRAEFWLRDLRWGVPGETSPQQTSARRQLGTPVSSADGSSRRQHVSQPVEDDPPPAPQPLPAPRSAVLPQPAPAPRATVGPQTGYDGARSGTLTCTGEIPQNAEFVFRNLPPLAMTLDYDKKIWSARLVPGDGQTQKLILRNISSGPQKKCVVHWGAVQ